MFFYPAPALKSPLNELQRSGKCYKMAWTGTICSVLRGRHGLVSLLYYQLSTICPESVPGALLNRLKTRFQANLAHNLFLTAELLKLLSLFENHGIPAVPFKGPVLASSVYGNLSLREFSDLDILIHREDFNKAKDLLLLAGIPTHLSTQSSTGSSSHWTRMSISLQS